MANELDAYKTEQTKLLEAQKARAQERAAINQQKLLKYLEQTSAGQSVGMTESAKIAAANNYSRDVAAADATYNQGIADLNHYIRTEQERLEDKEYERKWNEDERDYNRGRDAIADARYEDERDYNRGRDDIADDRYEDERDYNRGQDTKIQEKAAQDEIYGEVMTKIESGEFNTVDELSNYLNTPIDTDGDGNADSTILEMMSPTQRAMVEGKLSYYRANPEQQAADGEYYKTHNVDGTVKPAQVNTRDVNIGGVLMNMQEGNNFKINGYKVELGEMVVETGLGNDKTDPSLPSDILQTTSDGQIFEYNGQLYYRSRFDNVEGEVIERIFKVRGRGGSDTEDYKSVLALYV